jgi:hypothetical protein
MTFPGPSRTIIVEPLERPAREPKRTQPEPAPERPTRKPAPAKPKRAPAKAPG